jgi:ribosomal protein L11 methyltransferase
MPKSWKLTALAPRETVEAALVAHEEMFDWDPDIVLSGSELADDRPEEWRLEAYLPRKPRRGDVAAVSALFPPPAPRLVAEQLPDADWVTESQQGLEPIRAGQFHVRTPDYPPPNEPGLRDFTIPASQAFGTGQHATTSGCLAMLGEMKARGLVVRNLADIGAGTGLLAFAAMHLWPRALATASDIDPVCFDVITGNARLNRVPLGARGGELTVTLADGMASPLLLARGPYDLVMANILAGPLIEMAPHIAKALVPGGSLLLSGLLVSQEAQVRAACLRAGMRLAARMTRGDWSVLWLRKRRPKNNC